MEIEDITRIIEQTLVSPDLSKINSDNKGLFWKEQLKIVLSISIFLADVRLKYIYLVQ